MRLEQKKKDCFHREQCVEARGSRLGRRFRDGWMVQGPVLIAPRLSEMTTAMAMAAFDRRKPWIPTGFECCFLYEEIWCAYVCVCTTARLLHRDHYVVQPPQSLFSRAWNMSVL